jgi:RNA polymerase sigma-70 factor (ECF subfamily)
LGGRTIENCRATRNYCIARRRFTRHPARRNADVIIARPELAATGALSLATDKELSDFLKSVEKRAWKRAVYAVRDDDAALDIVQDTMIRLSEKYADRPAAELPLLFQRILSNATMDWFRRQKVKNQVVRNFSEFETAAGGDGDFDILETLEALGGPLQSESAAESVSRAQILQTIEAEVALLPGRQREAFLLRYWEELDVAETAASMGCSEGSVKTHCSRAVHALAKALKAKGITS